MRKQAAPREGGKLISGAGVTRIPAGPRSGPSSRRISCRGANSQLPWGHGAGLWVMCRLARATSSSSMESFMLLLSPPPPNCDRFVKVKWYFLIKLSTLMISAHFPLMPSLLSDLGVTLNLSGLESLCVIE